MMNKVDITRFVSADVIAMMQEFEAAGYSIRIVGGAVRDFVINRIPKDIDLATCATPNQMAEFCTAHDYKFIETGLDHGTITIMVGDEPIEVTTLRIDEETDGRHASVSFTTSWEEDAARRDLTFNAMSIDLNGQLFDYFNGEEDLINKTARFVGDADTRIKEDYLRILRYFRFQARFDDIKWDAEACNAIKENAKGLDSISIERIWAETQKLIASAPEVRKEVFEMMLALGVDVFGKDMSKALASDSTEVHVFLANMCRSLDDVVFLRRKLKFDNQMLHMVNFIVKMQHFEGTFENACAFMVEPTANKTHVEAWLDFKNAPDVKAQLQSWEVPTMPVNGRDLLEEGMTPGPEMKVMLNAMRTVWVVSNFTMTKEELLKKVKMS